MRLVPRVKQSERALYWRRVAFVFLLACPAYIVGGNLAIANGSPFVVAHSVAFFLGCLAWFALAIPVGVFFWWPFLKYQRFYPVYLYHWH